MNGGVVDATRRGHPLRTRAPLIAPPVKCQIALVIAIAIAIALLGSSWSQTIGHWPFSVLLGFWDKTQSGFARRRHAISPGFSVHYQDLGISS